MNRTPNKDGTVSTNTSEPKKFVSEVDRQENINYQSARHDAVALVVAIVARLPAEQKVTTNDLIVKVLDVTTQLMNSRPK